MPDGLNLNKPTRKSFSGAVKALGDRQVRVIVSTSSEDREGDVIEVAGVDLTNYKRNPVILFNHRHDCPIARCISIGLNGGRLEAVAEFPPEGISDKADEVYRLIKAGIINCTSIGFIPKEWSFIDDDSWARRFAKSEMIEFSFVSVPANAEAMILERNLSGYNDPESDMSLKDLLGDSSSLVPVSYALHYAAKGAQLAEGRRVSAKTGEASTVTPEAKTVPAAPDVQTPTETGTGEQPSGAAVEGSTEGTASPEAKTGESQVEVPSPEPESPETPAAENKGVSETEQTEVPEEQATPSTTEMEVPTADVPRKSLARYKAELELIRLRAGVV